ncbi:hypothetical protein C8Q77DRAFT_152445 [Trametes polyzona]|nr:hypothetical protein C8Q77DRAFT_152445 [Trametes polyzona]
MSIQFLLCWMPVLVLSAWWTGRPLHLLFGKPSPSLLAQGQESTTVRTDAIRAPPLVASTDYYEVALLLGSCFLVICVTADGKTNLGEVRKPLLTLCSYSLTRNGTL